MDNRTVLKGVQLGIGFLPSFIVIIGLATHKYFAFILSPVLLVIAVTFLPLFRKNANLWTFVFTAALSIPLNIYIILVLKEFDLFLYDDIMFMDVLTGILYYCILFSAEEIIMGSVVEIIREKKYKKEKNK